MDSIFYCLLVFAVTVCVSETDVCDVCSCSARRGGTVDCTGKQLTELTQTIPGNTSVLILSNNYLTTIPENALLSLEHLTELNLSNNNLTTIPEDALLSLEHLTWLYLDNNLLSKLPKLPKPIQLVSATNNKFTETDYVFQNLTFLSVINFENNNISKLRGDMFQGSRLLRDINFNSNPIEEIEHGTFRGVHINTLRLSYNHLETLLTDAFTLNQIASLYIFLDHGLLNSLPYRAFDNCPVDTSIFMDNCNLTRLEKGVFDGCSTIGTLSLENNQISYIDDEAFDSVCIIHGLFLTNNMLTEISPAVSMCTVTQLILSFNSIETLGTGKIGTNATEGVMLSQNNISSIGKANFKGMTNLKVLMIAHNNISSIDDYAFDDTNLYGIYLYGNQLSSISQFAFKMPEEKQQAYLYIHDNPIYTIDEDSFASLKIVYLSCEQLHKLPNSVGQNVNATCTYDGINIKLKGLNNAGPEKESVIRISGIECPGKKQIECTFCQKGTFGNKDEHPVCLKCPPGGYYQDMLGFVKTGKYTTDCKRCPNGTFSTEAGASSMSNCLACPLGTQTDSYAGLNACDCSSMFHRFDRFEKCIPCPSEGVDCSGGYQQLQNGYWWSWNFTNSICYGNNHSGSPAEYDEFINGLNNSTFDVSDPEELKNVKYHGSIPSVHRCPRPKSCISNGTLAACAEGYEGWRCVVCKKGYYTLFYECHKCPHSTILLLMFSVVTLLVVLIGTLTFKYQTILRQKYDKLNIKSVSMYVKIAINYYQIIGILSVRRNDLSKTSGGNLFIYLDVVGYINLLSPRCIFYGFAWNAYKQAVLSICVPVVIILLGCVAVIIVTIKRKRNVDFPVTNGLVCFIVLLLLYFTYANTCSGIMAIGPWAYRTFNVTHDGSCTRTMLKMDYSIIIPNDTGTNAYLILCYLSFLYVIGFPVSIGCILYYVRRRRRPPVGRYHSYQQLLSTDCSNIGGENNEEHAFNNEAIVNDILNSIDYEQTEQPNHQHGQKQRCQWPQQHQKQEHHLSFFYVEYTSSCWFWEVIEIFTKAALALIVNYENYSDVDIAYSVLVIVCLILLHIHFRPIKNKFAQRFQITTLVYVVLNLSVKSILSREGIGRTSETVTSGVLTCINASVVVIAVVVFVQTFFGGLIRKKFASVIVSCFCDPKQA